MNRMKFYAALLTSVLLFASGICAAQVATGTPPFNSFGGGPFDTVNLGNLNVNFITPIFNKSGRGIPFLYNLSYDSSIWSPVKVGSSTVWQPAGNWGWQFPYAAHTGEVTFSSLVHTCVDGPERGSLVSTSNYIYHDIAGISHPFAGGTFVETGACGNQSQTSFTSPATDGSGLTLSVASAHGTITTKDGVVLNTPSNLSNGSTTVPGPEIDPNGNEITASSSNGVGTFTDTLGQAALTVSGVAPNSTNFQYTPPSGTPVNVVMSYRLYTVQTNFQCSGISEYGPTSAYLIDKITYPDNSYYQFTYEPTQSGSQNVTGRIASVSLPTGGTITYQYTGGSNGIECADGSTAGLTRTVNPGGQWTYSRSGSGNSWTTTIVDPESNETSVEFAKDSATNPITNNFYETKRQVYQGSTTLLLTILKCYNGNFASCDKATVSSPINQLDTFAELPSNAISLSEKTYSVGLLQTDKEYDYGVSPGQAPTGIPLENTSISYAALGNGIVGEPASIVTKDGSGNIISKTTYGYDESALQTTSGTPQHINISGSHGNLTSVGMYPSSTLGHLLRQFSYYDTGNVYQATDVNNAVTTYTYGACGNSFPTQVSLPLGLSTSATWNCVGGVQLSATDPNGMTATTTYNEPYFWRPAQAQDPNLNTQYFAFYNPNQSDDSLPFNAGISLTDSSVTVDGFGRVTVSQQQQGQGIQGFDSVETDYDALGRPNRVTMPYSTGTRGGTNSGAPATKTTYDALNRPLQVTDGGGGYVSYTYIGNDVLQAIGPAPTNENLKQKQLEYDALGRLTSVCEITTGSGSGACGQVNAQTGYWTKYAYEFYNGYNRVTVTQNAQSGSSQTRTYLYDLLGRLVSETNPESGTTSYFYDTNAPTPGYNCQSTSDGDMVKSIDANGNTMCYAYDSLHRLAQKFAVGPNNPQNISNYYVYDAATVNGAAMGNTKGRIAEAYTATCYSCSKITDEGFSYDADGNETDFYEFTPSSAGYYHVNETYWPNGVIESIGGLPGVATITYGVEGEGRPWTASASSGQMPVTATSYNTASEATGVTFGSGDSDSYQFDPNTGRMSQYTFTMGSLTDIGIPSWNTNGSLGSLQINDQINSADSQNCSYLYDDLERLASANCGSVWNQSFGYDPFGNITKSGSSAWQPGYNSATNQYTLGGTSYDEDGNLLADTFHNYTWNGDGQVSSIDGNAIVFDAFGRQVEYGNGQYQFVYAPGVIAHIAVMSGQSLLYAQIPLPGGAKVLYNSSGLWLYHHSDWLGSGRLYTTANRTMYTDKSYAAFGEIYGASGGGAAIFAGANGDTVFGLYDFTYRKYSPSQGRWISPDPAGMVAADPTNPQSWNRYAYVGNNPPAYVDPYGLFYGPCAFNPSLCSGGGGGEGGGGGGGGGGNGAKAPETPPSGQGGGSGTAANNGVNCSLTIKTNNKAGMTTGQIESAEQQIKNLFAQSIGVNFVMSGANNFTLNFANANPGNSLLGVQTSFLFLQFSPNVYVNNILNTFSGQPPSTINSVIGTVGAHELMHRITGTGDLPFDPNNPSDLMSADNNPDAYNLFVNNGFQLTQIEQQQLNKVCLAKTPN